MPVEIMTNEILAIIFTTGRIFFKQDSIFLITEKTSQASQAKITQSTEPTFCAK